MASVKNIEDHCKLKYIEIFTHDRLKSETRIIIEGGPGTGKTMLLAQLALDWCQGKIENVDILIFLPLKIVKDKTLIQAIREFYIPENTPLSGNDIADIVASDKEKICLLLDGLEEYTGGREMRAKESSDVKKIVKKEKYPNCKVVLTCCSYLMHDLSDGPLLKMGQFSETERNSYIEKMSLDNIKKEEKMKQVIEDDSFLLGLCSIPLLFALAVHSIENMGFAGGSHVDKVSPFMQKMVETLWASSMSGYETWSENEQLILGELAFNDLCEGQQQFSWPMDFIDTKISRLKHWLDSRVLVVERDMRVHPGTKFQDISEDYERHKSDEMEHVAGKTGTSQSLAQAETQQHKENRQGKETLSNEATVRIRFLHEIIQEWFAATYLCSMMNYYTDEDQFHEYVISQLNLLHPKDLHYVLRFASYLHPRSCHAIINYLLTNFLSDDGSIESHVMDCICLCFAEHNDIKGTDMKNSVTEVCKEVIAIDFEDGRFLQKAKSSLLQYASDCGVIIEEIQLGNVISDVDETSLTLNSGTKFRQLNTLQAIEVSQWDHVRHQDDFENILKLLSKGNSIETILCVFPCHPPKILDEVIIENVISKNLEVEWNNGEGIWTLDPKKQIFIPMYETMTKAGQIELKNKEDDLMSYEHFLMSLPGTSSSPFGKWPTKRPLSKTPYSDMKLHIAAKRLKMNWNLKLKSEKEYKKEEELDLSEDSMLQSTITEASHPFKNEPVQVRSCRCPELYISHHHLSPLHVEKVIDRLGGKLDIPQSGISLDIPPDAIEKAVKISLSVVSDPDISLPIDDGLPVVTPVVRCDPCGLHFNKKVTLDLPHCAVVDDESLKTSVVCYSGCYESGSSISWGKHSEKVDSSLQTSLTVLIDHFCYFVCKARGLEAKAVRVVPFSQKMKDKLLLNLWVCNDIESVFDGLFQSEKSLNFQLQATWESFIVYKILKNIEVKVENISEHEETINLSRIWSGQQVKASFTIERISDVDSIELKIKQALNDDDVTKFHLELQEDNSNGNERGLRGEAHADSMTTEFQYLSKKLLSNEWESVGRTLGIENAKLDHIKKENTGTREAIYKMLVHWKSKYGTEATHARLIQCLGQADRRDLADDILNRKDQEDAR